MWTRSVKCKTHVAINHLGLREITSPTSGTYLSEEPLSCLPATWWHSRKAAVAALKVAGNTLCAS